MPPRHVTIPRRKLVGPVTGTTYRQARALGLIDRQPNANEKLWLRAVLDVQTRLADLLPLTPRAYAYRIAGVEGFSKSIATEGMADFLSLARRARWIPWGSVDDSRTRTIQVPTDLTPEALDEKLVRIADNWERWRRLGQGWVPEVWVEAVGSMRSVEDPARDLGAAIVSSGGTNSLTEIGKLAARAARRWRGPSRANARKWRGPQMRTVLMLIGDYDRKGRERFDRTIAEGRQLLVDVHGFTEWGAEYVLHFEWVAVTPTQITEWELASSDDHVDLPAQERNYEVEAVDPADLRNHLTTMLTRRYTSTRLLDRVVEASRREGAVRVARLGQLDEAAPRPDQMRGPTPEQVRLHTEITAQLDEDEEDEP